MDWKELPKHEANGIIRLARVQGRTDLFGCPVRVMGFMQLEISECELHHDRVSGDHYDEGKHIATIWMSATQFAEMITTPNVGVGVPCTLRHYRDGEKLKECEPPPRQESEAARTRHSFREEVEQRLDAMRAAREEVAKVTESLSARKREAVLETIDRFMKLFTDSAPFMMERFEEHAEEVVGRAKGEISAFAEVVAQRTGIEALKAGACVPALESGGPRKREAL